MNNENEPTQKSNSIWLKIGVLVLILAGAAAAYYFLAEYLSLEGLAAQETKLRESIATNSIYAGLIAFIVYVTVAGFSLPGAAVLSLVIASLFGFWPGLLIVSFGSTTGATLAFWASRFLLRETIQTKFGSRLEKINEGFEKEGAFYLFTLRLIPAFPFWLVNLLMGVTKVKTRTFWWVSQIGMLPGTAVYVFAGSQFPTLDEIAKEGVGKIFDPLTIGAFVLLGVTPLIIKKLLQMYTRRKSNNPHSDEKSGTD